MDGIINRRLREDGTLEIYIGNRLFVEVEDGRDDEEFVAEVIHDMGYEWLPNGRICMMDQRVTKQSIYDEICAMLTAHEEARDAVTEDDWYDLVVKIQNNWEAVITKQEG